MANKVIERIPCVGAEGQLLDVLIYQRIGYRRNIAGSRSTFLGQKSIALEDSSAVEQLSDGAFRVIWSGEILRRLSQNGALESAGELPS